jgi:hypothetical protein
LTGSNTGFSYPEKERKREDKMADRKKLEEALLEKAKGGKIPCAVCFKIAEDFGISKKEMGQVLNDIKVKISQCQLGCFD